jgi:hypothetical protein
MSAQHALLAGLQWTTALAIDASAVQLLLILLLVFVLQAEAVERC